MNAAFCSELFKKSCKWKKMKEGKVCIWVWWGFEPGSSLQLLCAEDICANLVCPTYVGKANVI